MDTRNLRHVGGVVDLGQFKEKKTEEQIKREKLERIASMVSPQLFIEDDKGEQIEFEVLTSAIRADMVLLMVGRVNAEEPIPMFLTLPHDGEELSGDLRPMTEDEFNLFHDILVRSNASMIPLQHQPVDAEDNPEDK